MLSEKVIRAELLHMLAGPPPGFIPDLRVEQDPVLKAHIERTGVFKRDILWQGWIPPERIKAAEEWEDSVEVLAAMEPEQAVSFLDGFAVEEQDA